MNTIEELIASNGYRLTAPRRSVFTELQTATRPLSIAELSELCRDIDRVSIYRTLNLFSTLNIINVIAVGWKKQYELAGPFKPHHHHLQCVSCGELVAIDTPRLEGIVTDLATSHGYQLAHHHIELHGICKKCQKA